MLIGKLICSQFNHNLAGIPCQPSARAIASCSFNQGLMQASKWEPRIMRYELSDYEWTAIKPMLPNKPRGVRRVNDRHVLNGIFWVLVRHGATCQRPMVLATLVTIASFAGGRLASGTVSWMRWPPVMTRRCR